MTPPIHVTVTTDRDGAPIVSKLGRTPEAKARLRREAWILGGLRHPGVVELVELRDVDEDVRLDLTLAGSRTLADAGPQPPSQIASILASVATTLADVHTQGMGHRRLTADHIVLDRNGQPVVAGWAEAGPPHLGDDDRWVDPHAEDVAAVGSLLVELLEDTDERKSRSERTARRKLVALAKSCAADRAPTMHEVGAQLARLAGSASAKPDTSFDDEELLGHAGLDDQEPNQTDTDEPPLTPTILLDGADQATPRAPAATPAAFGAVTDEPTDADDHPRRTANEPRRLLESLATPRALAGAGALALVLFATLGWILRDDAAAPSIERVLASTTSTQPEQQSRPTTSALQNLAAAEFEQQPAPAIGDCAAGAADRGDRAELDVDGDGCADRVAIDGNRVQVGDTTYEVGRPGDTVLVGDWDCDGRATPIVIRPDDQAIHVFNRWARADQGLAAVFGGQMPADTTAEVADDGEGCHVLELTGPRGVERRQLQELGGTG